MRTRKQYDNDAITKLKGPDRVRKKPEVIFGSNNLEGCEHACFEILSNSIDEAREGFGKRIWLTRFHDGSFQVMDEGRGVPIDFNKKENEYNWSLIFCELYAGGKYNNNSEENYSYSLGLNGLGACATQYSSEYMDVVSVRDGYRYSVHFEKGYNKTGTDTGFKREKSKHKTTGTAIRWKPDKEVFTDIDVPKEFFLETLKRQAIVNAGIRFIFRNESSPGQFEETSFFYARGIREHLESLIENKQATQVIELSKECRGRDADDRPEYKLKMNVVFCFCPEAPVVEYYHNSSRLEYGGAPDKAVRTAFVQVLDAYIKKIGKYTKSESKITAQDVFDNLTLVSNCFSTLASYENQTKKSVNNKFIQEAMTEFLKEELERYLAENKVEADKIAAQILVNKRSREQAEKSRISIKKKLSGNIDVTNKVQKFVDCRTKDVNKRELYIVEGDSALGSCKQGRDAEFQAIMPIRGKILNCLKADLSKIFKSDIITDLVRVLGCGVEVKSGKKDIFQFDVDKLRWGKIIICTDADVDGYQIRTLVLTMIYRLCQTLIDRGYVYIAESPLYEITYKDKTYFAFDEKEKAQYLKKLDGKKFHIQRSKGLGENEPEMMWETTMNPASRRLIQIAPTDAENAAKTFDLLLGDNLQGRKNYIAAHGNEYLEQLDVS